MMHKTCPTYMHSNVLCSMLNNVLQNYLYEVECLKSSKVLLLKFMLETEVKWQRLLISVRIYYYKS